MNQKTVRTIFFGSALDSLPTLNVLNSWKHPGFAIELLSVVTQPPRPVGRHKIVTPTPVQEWAEQHHIPVLSFPSIPDTPWLFADESAVADSLSPFSPDLIVVTYYGQKIPWHIIQSTAYGGINIHPSLLPRWRGADPVPWAILSGDHQVGVTVLTLAEQFDKGIILGQKKIPVADTDMTNPLYKKLFILGATLLGEILQDYLNGNSKGTPQGESTTPYARRLKREDGYESWGNITRAIKDGTDAARIDRKYRALTPWPGLWTTILIHGAEKRLKILEATLTHGKFLPLRIQVEGKMAVSFNDFRRYYSI